MTRAGAIAGAALLLAGCDCGLVAQIEGAPCDPGNVCPAGFVCQAGTCHATGGTGGGVGGGSGGGGADLCVGITCDAPPAASCVNGSTLRTFAGSCNPQSGSCNYAPMDTACPMGCANGVCTGDPCAGIVCTQPPAPTCDNGGVVTSSLPGTCNNGHCRYQTSTMGCGGSACQMGACVTGSKTFAQVLPRVRHAINAVDVAPGSQGQNVVVVSPTGELSSWNGQSWTTVPAAGPNAALTSVWFASQNVAFVTSTRGLSRWNGSTLTAVNGFPTPTGFTLVDVHGHSESDLVVAGDDATVYRFNGNTWTTTTQSSLSGPYAMKGVWVDDADRIRVFGTCNGDACIVYSSLGISYQVQTDGTGTFTAVGPAMDTGNFAWAGATGEAIRRHDPAAVVFTFDSTDVPSLMMGDGDIVGITGVGLATSARAVWVLTSPGTSFLGSLYRVSGTPSALSAPVLSNTFYGTQHLSKNDASGVIFVDQNATTQKSTIVRRSATVEEALDVGAETWATVSPAGTGYILLNAFGDAFASLNGATFQVHRTTQALTTVDVAAGSAYAVFVGSDNNGGMAQKVPLTQGAAYVPLSVPVPPSSLNAICRVSDSEWYFAGESGSIYKFDGTTVTEMPTGTNNSFVDIDCGGTSGVAVACGKSGAVFKLANGVWSALSGGPSGDFTTCRLTGGTIYVGGDNVFARYSGGNWASLPSKASLVALVAVSANELYAVSGGTAVLRFNGSTWSSITTSPQTLVGGGLVGNHVMFAGKAGVVLEGQ